MPRFEYVEVAIEANELGPALTEYGSEGWELALVKREDFMRDEAKKLVKFYECLLKRAVHGNRKQKQVG